jgi:rubrerythrin
MTAKGAKKTRTAVPAKRRSAAAKRPSRKAAAARGELAEFMKRAYAMELEASTRYAEFADQMEVANNREVAELFRKLAGIEKLHASKILEQMGWKTPPADLEPFRWEGLEGPETGETNDLHYLMQPYHALQIALRNEERAARFFASIARRDLPRTVLDAAQEMAEEEREHVELVKAWMARVPKPEKGWDTDLDPPNVYD